MKKHLRSVLLASTGLALFLVSPAHAAAPASSTADTLAALQTQVTALQKQIADMQAKDTERAETVKKAAEAEAAQKVAAQAAPAAASQTASSDPGKKEILPGVSVKLGGYIAAEGLYRTKNEASDIGTTYASIPLKNSSNDKTDEFRGSARASRLSLLTEGKPDQATTLNAYVEADFNSTGTSSNSTKTNSYTMRLRQAFASYDQRDWGFYFAGGQAFSLASMNAKGLYARQELGVQTIDSSGPPGYVYTRAPQIRFVKDFDNKKWALGLSLEDPEVNFNGVTAPTNYAASSGSYSNDYAPDVIVKAAYDPSFGHFEAFSLTRFFRDVSTTNGNNQYAVGQGFGVGALVPIVKKKLEVTANGLVGKGVGRYGATTLPDLSFDANGHIKPLTQLGALVGLLGHPTEKLDVYLYAGAEKVLRQDEGSASTGYGSTLRNVSGCYTLGSAASTCSDQTKMIWQITPGFWQQVYKGDYGNMKVGGQYSLTRREDFSGAGGLAPHAMENTFLVSFRYAPF